MSKPLNLWQKLQGALLVAANDTRIRCQQRVALAFIVVLPLVLTLIMGFAVRSLEPQGPQAKVALVDLDQGPIGQKFLKIIKKTTTSPADSAADDESADSLAQQLTFELGLSIEEARQQMNQGDLDGVIILPEGLSQRLDAKEPVTIDVLVSPGESATRSAVEANVDRLILSVSQTDPLPLGWSPQSQGDDKRLVTGFSSFTQSVAGNGVMFILLNCMATGGLAILSEKRLNTLSRMMISPLTPGTIILGKTFGVFLVGVAQAVVIFGFGLCVGVSGYDILGVVLVTLAFIFVGSALGLTISAIARREENVQMICMPTALVMTALGGGMFPMEMAPAWLKPVSLFFPTGWAMDAYRKLMWDGLDWISVLPNLGVLIGFALVFYVIGIWTLRLE